MESLLVEDLIMTVACFAISISSRQTHKHISCLKIENEHVAQFCIFCIYLAFGETWDKVFVQLV